MSCSSRYVTLDLSFVGLSQYSISETINTIIPCRIYQSILSFNLPDVPYAVISPNCRQILKILGFFSEPQQAPISFVPATLQTADATSSLPGATLMWVRRCSTNRALTDLCRQEWYGLGMEHGGRLLSIRHAAILWWQVARSASLGDVDNKEKIIVWSEVQCLCRRAWFYELKSIQVV